MKSRYLGVSQNSVFWFELSFFCFQVAIAKIEIQILWVSFSWMWLIGKLSFILGQNKNIALIASTDA
jgi:hypothetical protein